MATKNEHPKQIRNMPLVSVIITTKNEAKVIEKLLKSIKNQSLKNFEIIVIDNHSTDKTLKISKKYTKKTFTYGPERSAQRNYGASKSRGEYLLFLDADMELENDVLKECVQEIKKDKRNGAMIIAEISEASSFWEKVKAFERSIYNLKGDSYTDAARFFTKKAFKAVGGFDLSITGPEDWDFPEAVTKLGFKTGRIKSKIHHKERIDSLFSLLKKKFYYGLKSHRYLKKQKIGLLSPKTIYFLRPVFYKNWRLLFANPLMTISMIFMLLMELIAGGAGFIIGSIRRL